MSSRQEETSMLRSSSALIVVKYPYKTVRSMVKILSNLNANFAVVWLNGFAGATPISVNPVINGSAMEIT